LRGIGIQPDVLLCRCKNPLPDEQRRKIALFTNVEERAVISGIDADDIYKIPMLLHEQGLDEIVVDKLRSTCRRRSHRVEAGRRRRRRIRMARSTSRWSANTSR
jgi:CTP synthase (UTP-ammonia lyase)